MSDTSRAGLFTGRVAVLFGTQVVGAGISIINGILVARLLGPAAKGDYYVLLLVPSTVMALTLLGLPQAFGYFAARGRTIAIVSKSIWLATALASAGAAGTLLFLPLLRETVLDGLEPGQILFAFLALPLALSVAFSSAIVMGRQAVRWYAAITVAAPIATTFLILAILVGLGPSVGGAIAVYLIVLAIQTVAFVIVAGRVCAAVAGAERVSYRELLRYALPFYPANLTVHFNYRIDAYLIAWLMPASSAPLGYYSMAVALAELVFFFPNAVSTLFFPHVAGSSREESDRQVAMVSRVTLLVTGAVGLLLIPAAALMIWLLLPAFSPALPAFLVLLPGVVVLSASKVVAGYMTGTNRPGVNTFVSFATLASNIIANVLLIPQFGIVGAATASLISYSISSLIITTIAARITRTRFTSFWIPRVSDIRYVAVTLVELLRRYREATPAPGQLPV